MISRLLSAGDRQWASQSASTIEAETVQDFKELTAVRQLEIAIFSIHTAVKTSRFNNLLLFCLILLLSFAKLSAIEKQMKDRTKQFNSVEKYNTLSKHLNFQISRYHLYGKQPLNTLGLLIVKKMYLGCNLSIHITRARTHKHTPELLHTKTGIFVEYIIVARKMNWFVSYLNHVFRLICFRIQNSWPHKTMQYSYYVFSL